MVSTAHVYVLAQHTHILLWERENVEKIVAGDVAWEMAYCKEIRYSKRWLVSFQQSLN